MSTRLSPLDATFLELEDADDAAHMHIGGVLVLEGPAPSLEEVRELLSARLGLLPLYRCRLSGPRPGALRFPAWVEDERFDLRAHVRHAALPAPGGRDELLEFAADFWSHRLDRHRPLWEAVLVDGIEGGGWALVTKTHHCMVDGVGSVDVAHLLLDADRGRSLSPPAPPEAPAAAPERHDGPSLLRGAASAIRHPRRSLARAGALAELVLREELVAAPDTPLNGPIGATRCYDALTVDLAEVKLIRRELGGTVNDVALSAVAAGLRALLEAAGAEPCAARTLRAMVPVNVRAGDEHGALGNRISSLFVELPVGLSDPLERLRATIEQAHRRKASGQAGGSAALLELTALAPPLLHAQLAKTLYARRLFNVTVTNVPGPQIDLYALGSRLEEVLPLVPLAADHAVGVAIVSCSGRLTFGLVSGAASVPDLGVMREAIAAELGSLRRIAAGRRSNRTSAIIAPPARA